MDPATDFAPATSVSADLAPAEDWLDDLRRAVSGPMSWLWDGYLAPGNITLMTSQWKSGKTTLLSVLLAKLQKGGTLAGLNLAAGNAAIISEESRDAWLHRADKLGFGNHVCWFCRPFPSKPTPAQWLALIDRLVDVHTRRGLSLVAIDPLTAFLPARSENSSDRMFAFLATLQRLTGLGLSVLILHHPAKRELGAGLAARGSGVLPSFVDILIEMRWYNRASEINRRRRLLAFSRHDLTPRQRVIELTDDGADYVTHGDFQDDEFANNWLVLKGVLEVAHKRLTRPEITKGWPPDFLRPPRTTLWRWLDRAVANGLLLRDGTGWKGDPFRYWLPGQEASWPEADTEFEKLMAQIEAANAHVIRKPSQPLPPPSE